MSRIYEALQQSSLGRVDRGTPEGGRTAVVLSDQFRDSKWDPNAALQVQPHFSDREKLPTLFSKQSLASEQFRLLATRLQQLQQSRAFKSVLLTSAVAGEGKSLLTFNLATSLAQGGRKRVLIVDADLRKKGLSLTFDIDGREGLREWYQTDRPISEFICRITDINVWALPAGQATVDPLELLMSPRIPDLLVALNAVFDWVLIDSPPLLPLADAEIISRVCDGTMIVVRRDTSQKSALTQALDRVAAQKMIGLLLNDFPVKATYGYPECLLDKSAASSGSSVQVQQLWNWSIDVGRRALRYCSITFGRLVRRGA